MIDAIAQFKQYDYDGKLVRNIKLPGVGTVGGFKGKKDDKALYYSFSNYTTPNTTYTFEPNTAISRVYNKPKIDLNSDNFESKQVFYHSKDGARVAMIIS